MNPTLKKIKENIVDPEIRNIRNTAIGYITAVYYEKRTCDVVYIDKDNAKRVKKDIPFLKDGDGVFSQSLRRETKSNWLSGTKRGTPCISAVSTKKGKPVPILL